MSNRWYRAIPLIVLSLALMVLFHRLLLGEVIFWGTPLLQFYPWETYAWAQIRAGNLPLWNPLVGNGAPLIANYQSAIFYPPNWLYLFIPVEYGMGIIGVAHLLWAGLGMRAYLRRLDVGMLGQGVGVIGFALSGYLLGRFGFLSITLSVSWLPWLMWAVDGTMLGQAGKFPKREVGLLGIISGMQLLAGHAQITTYSHVLAGLYALYRLCQAWTKPRIKLVFQRLLYCGAGILIGVSIAAIQLLPTLELMQTSQRSAGVEREFGLAYSFWPYRFLTLLAPNLFGSPAAGNYDGFGAYWEDSIYVGLLTIVMSAHGVARWLRERKADTVSLNVRVVPFFLIILPIALLLALGENTLVFIWLFEHISFFSLFQAPTRWSILAVFGFSVLAAIGIDAWRSSERGLFWTRLLTAGGFAFFAGSLVAVHMAGDVRSTFLVALIVLGATIIIQGALSQLLPVVDGKIRWKAVWEVVVLGFLAIDLVIAHQGLTPTLPASYYHERSSLADIAFREAPNTRIFYLPGDENEVKIEQFLSFKDFQAADMAHWTQVRESLLPNLAVIDRIPSSNNFDPLLARYYVSNIGRVYGDEEHPLPEDWVQQVARMGVGILVSTSARDELDLLGISGSLYVYKIPDPWARVVVGNCDRSTTDIVCEPSGTGTASIIADKPQHVEVHVSASNPTTLVLLDTFYPGWQATVDGNPAPIQVVNHGFRGVDIPAGDHAVTFSYAPQGFMIGAWITLVGVIVMLALFFDVFKNFAANLALRLRL